MMESFSVKGREARDEAVEGMRDRYEKKSA
ncbi:MAG: hypothetical protein ACJA16_005793 [Akkermansiaceae bacterium]|jgi:hypothetical protein